jgi:hypothetical protein
MMIFTTIKTAFNVARGWTVQHSPEILLGTSIAAGIGATVTGCIATKKMEAINKNHREILDIFHNSGVKNEEGNIEYGVVDPESPEYKRRITKEYGRYWFDIAKTWAPCVGLTLLSGTCALGSFKIVNKRLIAAETAFTGIAKAFEQYRDNVIEDQGLEKDEYYASNGALKKKQELIAKGKYKQNELPVSEDPNFKVKKVDEIFFYDYNEDTVDWAYYSHHPFYNYNRMTELLTVLNYELKMNGIVFLDDVYKRLGLDMKTLLAERAQGRTYGWVLDCYTEDGMPNDQHVLFGIYEYNDTQHRLFRAGQINDIMLHFNCRLLTPETCAKFAKG